MPNRLATETSPYLLQHAGNPVDWFPWDEEAFAKARQEDKPIFLSVGYSACHWCHVMEHESFEDDATSELMNRHFISIKVDREERPDVDAIYMAAVQALTGQGGWPMSVFLTPDAVPFYGGTYFPNRAQRGMPSFREVLTRVAELWRTRREDILSTGAELTAHLQDMIVTGTDAAATTPDTHVLDAAIAGLTETFDAKNGGWGGAPKFPQPAVGEFVLRRYCATGDVRLLEMVTRTLDAMFQGGICDQLGGGFHRYATDAIWLVPHFEKMLYDNAQLARLYLHAWQVTGEDSYRVAATRTLDYVARDMLDAEGGFYSAQDADSEGHEGIFYIWSLAEIAAILEAAGYAAADVELFAQAYGVTAEGNFEGRNILFVASGSAELAQARGIPTDEVEQRLIGMREVLLSVRSKRISPARDDKVLAGWNGLMLAAFAEAARIFAREDYRLIAEKNADFLLTRMRDVGGRMKRIWKAGHARLNGYLEDYAHCADGLIELYQTTFDPRWFNAARELADSILARFADPNGGFFDTSDDHESLLLRPKGFDDGVIPSGAAMATGVFLRLAAYTGDDRYAKTADAALAQVHEILARAPLGFAHWLSVLDFAASKPQELAIVGTGPERDRLLTVARARYRPDLVIAADAPDGSGQDSGIALLSGRTTLDGHAAAYVCRHFACRQPVSDPTALAALLDEVEDR